MAADSRAIITKERRLLKEISNMKFSFRKLVKIVELDAIISYADR